MVSKHPHIIVVGAGIVGASLTYHLAKQNARVTLIDKATKPANEVTGKSFAWINAGYDENETYLHLRQQAIADWHRIEDELNGRLKVDWCGALTWLKNTMETERLISKLTSYNSQVRLVDKREINLLEPKLKTVPALAMFAENEGAVNPGLTTELLIKAAHEAGANIQLENEVLSFIISKSGVAGLITANGNINADIIVLATGVNTTTLCKPLDLKLPIDVSPSILIEFYNKHRFVNRIVSNPFIEVRAASNTLTLVAEDYVDESLENNPTIIAQNTLKKMKEHWQDAEQIKLAKVMVGKRPIPQDGLPIIGRTTHIEGLYLLVMHSGVTLAAISGRLAAAEILNNQDDDLLSSYRPERFN